MSAVKESMAWDILEAAAASEARGVSPGEQARLALADALDLAGYAEDAEHLRKPVRVGDVLIPHTIAMAAMLVFAGNRS